MDAVGFFLTPQGIYFFLIWIAKSVSDLHLKFGVGAQNSTKDAGWKAKRQVKTEIACPKLLISPLEISVFVA